MFKLPVAVGVVVSTLAGTAVGQAVQLPIVQQFSGAGTVVVPDRGSVSMGGVRRSASGGAQFGGLPGNRSFGSATSAGGVRISVQIHDFEAMDRALLEAARAGRVSQASRPRQTVDRHSARLFSLSEIQRSEPAAEPAVERTEALLERASNAEANGNLGAARVYLQMASRKSTGALRQRALAEYRRLSEP